METPTSLLLVEGRSEENAIREFYKQWKIDINFDISSEGSITKLKTSFKMHLKSSNILRKLWVIIDADASYACACQSIRDILERSGKYNPPLQLCSNGLILTPIDENDLVVGVWIMPNNQDVGMLEDFMMGIIPEDNMLLHEAETVLTNIEKKNIQKYKNVHRAKAKLHTWLACHDDPGDSVNVAIRKNLFSQDKELVIAFRAWLMELNK